MTAFFLIYLKALAWFLIAFGLINISSGDDGTKREKGRKSKANKNPGLSAENETVDYNPEKGNERGNGFSVKINGQATQKAGSCIGRYRVISKLGQGGMGAIYKARSPNGRIVAIKIIKSEKNFDIDRFNRELDIISILDHNYIIRIRDRGFFEKKPYMVMDYADSINLRQYIYSAEKKAIGDILSIIIMVCEALKYAHSKGVIHLDIKPENILITKNGLIKIIDFGISKITSGLQSRTATDNIMGTPSYMSPEQKMGLKNIDSRSDIYSVGVLLYEMISGQFPSGLLRLDLIPKDIQLIIKRSIAYDREERYSDIDLMLVDLLEYKNKGNIQLDQDSLKAIDTIERTREVLLKHLYPSSMKKFRGFDYHVLYMPAFGIGGNYYDIIEMDKRYLGILVGNVFDKPDISSAIYLTMIRGFFKVFSEIDPDPAMVLTSVNRYISRESFDMFAMFSYIVLDRKEKRLYFSNAGYRPLYYYSSEKEEFSEIRTDGIGLGILPESKYSVIAIAYKPGDIFALCSSGVIEACNIEKIPFGKEKFLDIIKNNRSKKSIDIVHDIKSRLLRYLHGVAQNDDMTIALIKVSGNGNAI